MIEKKFDSMKMSELQNIIHQRKIPISYTIKGEKIIFEIHDVELIDYINKNFDDYIEIELRLDSIEGLLIGEDKTSTLWQNFKTKLGL
jgi:hypothetical protein